MPPKPRARKTPKGNEVIRFLIEMADKGNFDQMKRDPDSAIKGFKFTKAEEASVRKALKTKNAKALMRHVSRARRAPSGNVQVNCIL
jgi:hypothetical protein